jgi:hypothetical protein
MHRTVLFGFAQIARITVAAITLTGGLAFAQDVTQPSLKAAFIYNFAKFIEWPADVLAAGEPFVFCVVGDTAVGRALERAVTNRVLAGRNLTVSYVAAAGPALMCHILYVSGVPIEQAVRLAAGLRDEPVLTVSDLEGFTDGGGVVQLFFDRGQLRFIIHKEFARRSGLQISAKLMGLAKLK